MGILRAVAPAIIAYLVGKGYVSADQGGTIAAAIITLGSAVWSVATNIEAQAKPPVPPVKQ